jgi:sulfate transport system substrate-binding protein
VRKLYANVPVLDTGARGSLTTFAQRMIGDVAISWENEAHLALREMKAQNLEIVAPSVSILAEPSVAVVDKVVLRRGTRDLAEAYLQFLYSPEGQEICARNFYRPRDAAVTAQYAGNFDPVELVSIQHFGGWAMAQKTHFASGGIFDRITTGK